MACDPQDLLNQAKCFEDCLTPIQQESVSIYLLAQISGASTDPNTLLNNARCFEDCLVGQQLQAVQIYLLCQIAGV